jgi:outer membrane PBP1 activator LpoA protein
MWPKKHGRIVVPRIATILVAAALLSGCADIVYGKRTIGLEQEAIRNATTLCKKFGHTVDTKEFTRCAEQRYDEYMINHR